MAMDDDFRTSGFESSGTETDSFADAGTVGMRPAIPAMPKLRSGELTPQPKPLDGPTGFHAANAGHSDRDGMRARAQDGAAGTQGDSPRPGFRSLGGTGAMIPGLPNSAGRLSLGARIWFVVSFLVPVIFGAIYLFLMAPDQYVTEYRFSVRVPVGQPGSMAQGGASLSALFGGNPTPGTDLLDNFTVADYARSAQAAKDVDTKLGLKAMFNKPSDPFSRVGDTASQEKLAKFWKKMVYSDYDVTTGLAVVRVKAYSAEDSYSIANTLLQLSNDLVNSIGIQSQQDTVRYAKEQVDHAAKRVTDLRRELAGLSQQKGVDSPSIGVIAAQASLSTNARTNISQIQSQIEVLMQQLHNPNAPQIVILRQQLAANQRALANAVDNANAVPTNRYQDSSTQLQGALAVLSSAQAALSNAQAMSDSQRLYLTTYVKPATPESSTFPDRWMDLLLIALVAAMVWLIGLLLRNSILEHVQ